jgi:dCMP deaminase
MTRVDWDDYFMSMVYLVASKSKDIRSHIGAVIVGQDKEIKSTGYNSFVRGLRDDVHERQEKPEKYFWFEHAERNSVFNATLIGTSLKGCKMYTNGIPCMDCARAVVQSGIKEVIVDREWVNGNQGDDLEHSRRSLQMFEEVGVKVRYWEGKLLNIEKFRRGEVIDGLKNSNNIVENKMDNLNVTSKVKIKIKKLHPDAIVPQYAHPGDAGMDLFSVEEDFVLYPRERKVIGTGLAFELPEGYVSLFWDKSGMASKGIKLSGGVIEYTYRGEYKVVLTNLSSENFEIKKGQKIAQVLIQPIATAEVEVVDELSETERGETGFGASGLGVN